MATFEGTNGADSIRRNSLSPGVITDPTGQTGTLNGEINDIFGRAGDDLLEAGDGDGFGGGDSLYGGEGADTLVGGAGFDILFGDDGDDLIFGGSDAFSSDSYFGGAGDDRIYGTANAANSFDGGIGADTMVGGTQNDFYVVDNPNDKIVEVFDEGSVDDATVSARSYRLPVNVENMFFFESSDFRGIGNGGNNFISTGDGDDVLIGNAGNDTLQCNGGSDKANGGSGDDFLDASAGNDSLFGGSGQDFLFGGEGADKLYGGKGCDTFVFFGVYESTPTRRDAIRAEAGALAFNGAGRAKGDLIDVAGVDGDLTNNPSLIDPFVFGGTGKCHLSVANVGSDTLVRGNVDDDASFEFQILIADGAVRASAYSQFDFILTV